MQFKEDELEAQFLDTIRKTREYLQQRKKEDSAPLPRTDPEIPLPADLSLTRVKLREQSNSAAVAGAMRLLKTKIALLEDEVARLKERLRQEEQNNDALSALNQQIMEDSRRAQAKNQEEQAEFIARLEEQLAECQRQSDEEKDRYSMNMLEYIQEINGLKERIEGSERGLQRLAELEEAVRAKQAHIESLELRLQEGQYLAPKQPKPQKQSQKAINYFKNLLEELISKLLRMTKGEAEVQDYVKSVRSRMMKIDRGEHAHKSPRSAEKSRSKTRSRKAVTSGKKKRPRDQEEVRLQEELSRLKEEYFQLAQSRDPEAQAQAQVLLEVIERRTDQFLRIKPNQASS